MMGMLLVLSAAFVVLGAGVLMYAVVLARRGE